MHQQKNTSLAVKTTQEQLVHVTCVTLGCFSYASNETK